MDSVTVYKVGLYNALNDEPRTSRRMATAEGAAMMRGWSLTVQGFKSTHRNWSRVCMLAISIRACVAISKRRS